MKGTYVFYKFYCFIFIVISSFAGCCRKSNEPEILIETFEASPKLKLRNMPMHMPNNLEKRLSWALWKLDKQLINTTLNAGANPYTLASVVDVSRDIPKHKTLSPYALVIEGYLDRTYLEENNTALFAALNQLYECIEFLIKRNISVDQGMLTFGSHTTMRSFAHESLARLHAEEKSEAGLDDEGTFALQTWKRVQHLIDTYQPKQ